MQCGIGPKLKQLDARHAFNQRPCAVSHSLFLSVPARAKHLSDFIAGAGRGHRREAAAVQFANELPSRIEQLLPETE
jgi:hypothetical protein